MMKLTVSIHNFVNTLKNGWNFPIIQGCTSVASFGYLNVTYHCVGLVNCKLTEEGMNDIPWCIFSEHTLTSEFSENSYGWQQQRNHSVTSFSVSYQDEFTPLNNTDVCLPVCKEREKHTYKERDHTYSNFVQPSRNVVYTHLPPTDIWKFKWPTTVYGSARRTAAPRSREGRGSGHPTTWWWRDEVLCNNFCKSEAVICITTIKILYSISDDLSNTDILEYNYKCSGNKLQMSLDHWRPPLSMKHEVKYKFIKPVKPTLRHAEYNLWYLLVDVEMCTILFWKLENLVHSVYTQLQEVMSREQAIYIRTLHKSSILLYMIITESVYYYSHK